MSLDHYEQAHEHLVNGERWTHGSNVDAILAAAQVRATLALVDRLEMLTYLLYGEE